MDTRSIYEENFERGIALFNEGKFSEAHESWEPLLLNAQDPMDKHFLRGLIMTAGAFLHYKKRECSGASALLTKARGPLESGLLLHPEIRIDAFLRALDRLRETFDRCLFDVPVEDLPQIAKHDKPFVQRQSD